MKFKIILTGFVALMAAVAFVLSRPSPTAVRLEPLAADVTVARTNLSLVIDRLCLSGQTNPFTGFMIETGVASVLRSRSSISNGLLHGLSLGWHTNGQLQVSEHFLKGVSHGLRTKYYAGGAKLSEGEIFAGKFHGTFRRWSESGVLLEQAKFVEGQPDGVALAYFSNGELKARVVMRNGKPVESAAREESGSQP